MAEVAWTEPALADLDAIADYIAVDDPRAASALVRKIFRHVGQLADHPRSGSKLPELRGRRYRQIIEPPCRVIYREHKTTVFILHVVRSERLLRPAALKARGKSAVK